MRYERVLTKSPNGEPPLSLLVFLEELELSDILGVLADEIPSVVIPYWYPGSLYRTIQAAHSMVANTTFTTLVGIVATSPYDVFELVEGEFSPVVLGPDALGNHANKSMHQLEARGLFSRGEWVHVAHDAFSPVCYPPTRITYSDDFTYRRVGAT
jgi:hypothetical protein